MKSKTKTIRMTLSIEVKFDENVSTQKEIRAEVVSIKEYVTETLQKLENDANYGTIITKINTK